MCVFQGWRDAEEDNVCMWGGSLQRKGGSLKLGVGGRGKGRSVPGEGSACPHDRRDVTPPRDVTRSGKGQGTEEAGLLCPGSDSLFL